MTAYAGLKRITLEQDILRGAKRLAASLFLDIKENVAKKAKNSGSGTDYVRDVLWLHRDSEELEMWSSLAGVNIKCLREKIPLSLVAGKRITIRNGSGYTIGVIVAQVPAYVKPEKMIGDKRIPKELVNINPRRRRFPQTLKGF